MSLPGRIDPEATRVSLTPHRLGLAGPAPNDAVTTLRDGPASLAPTLPDLPVDPTRFPLTERDTYIIAGKFAQGGIGRILRAHDPRLDRPVALKELLVRGRPIDEERFIREVLLTARLQHPGIVPVYAAGRWSSGEPFYAMKLVSGRSFDRVIAEATSLAARLALLPHVLAIAETVAYAHSQRIIHRDLKPHNVLVGEFGETVVIDWGLAKELDVADAPADDAPPLAPRTVPPAQGLTFVGAVVGTPGYMSPEQADGADVDARTDVYALGAILYHVLTGRLPYDSSNQMNMVYRTVYEDPIPLRSREPDAPDELVAIVDKAMARALERRYASAREFADDLRRFQTGQIVGAHRYSPWERLRRFVRRHRAVLGLAAVSLLLVVAITAYSFLEIREERDDATAAREDAEDAERRAQAAFAQAQDRADNLSLQQARHLIATDPTAALRLLHDISPRADWRRTRLLAADLAQRGVPTAFHGHRAAISRAQFSPDGSLLATTSDDCTARIWDMSAKTSRALFGHTNHVWRASWSPDQRLLATTSRDRSVRVWDVATGEARARLAHEHEVRNVAFAPDGRTLYVGDDDKTLHRWDVVTQEHAELARCHVNNVPWTSTHVACIDDAAHGIYVYDTRTGERTVVQPPAAMKLTYIAGVSPDGRWTAASSDTGDLWLWDRERDEGRFLQFPPKLKTHPSPLREIRFSPDSRQLAAPAASEYLQHYDLAADRGELLTPHDSATRRAAFSPDGRKIASVGFDSNVAVHDVPTRTSYKLAAAALMIDTQFSADGRWLAAVGNDPRVFVWSTDTLRTEQYVPSDAPSDLPITHSESRDAALASRGDTLELVDLATMRARPLWRLDHPHWLVMLAGDGRTVLSLDERGELLLRDVRDGGESLRLQLDPTCRRPSVSAAPDRPRFLLRCEDERVLLLDPGAKTRLRELTRMRNTVVSLFFPGRDEVVLGDPEGHITVHDGEGGARRVHDYLHRINVLTAIPDSDRFFVACEDTVEQWRLSGEKVGELRGHQLQVGQVAVSADGRWALTSSRDNRLRVFEIATGEQRARLTPPSTIERLSGISRDGSRVATVVTDGDVVLWDLGDDAGGVTPRDEHRRLRGHSQVQVLYFEGDGRSLMTIGADRRLIRWRDELPDDPAGLERWLSERLGPPEAPEAQTSCAVAE